MRIVVGLDAGQDPEPVMSALRDKGAQHVQPPAPSLPDVVLAEFPEGDAGATIRDVVEIPGVRYAEPDELQSIM
jgi:hypothetical protein